MAKKRAHRLKSVVVDCEGCSFCCEWVLIKVKTKLEIEKLIKETSEGFCIVGDNKPIDKKYFKLHNISVLQSRGYKLFLCPTKNIEWKRVRSELWFKVNIKCSKLNSTGNCEINETKPDVCKMGACPKKEVSWKDTYLYNWVNI